jgi:hypothetical protein
MKVRDSGMPDEEMWSGFFDPAKVLAVFGLDRGVQDLVEFGCGYGTFMLAAAEIAAGTEVVLALEDEESLHFPFSRVQQNSKSQHTFGHWRGIHRLASHGQPVRMIGDFERFAPDYPEWKSRIFGGIGEGYIAF